jgi:hypothetical protein
LELVRNTQHPDKFHYNDQWQIDTSAFDCIAPRTFGAVALVRIVDGNSVETSNRDVSAPHQHKKETLAVLHDTGSHARRALDFPKPMVTGSTPVGGAAKQGDNDLVWRGFRCPRQTRAKLTPEPLPCCESGPAALSRAIVRFALKLSTTPCRYSFVPFNNRITVTFRCHISFGLLTRLPTLSLAGWMRLRGRRQPRSRINRHHVEAEA